VKLDVLVVGSTGMLGGAVAHALLRGGHHVRAMTRNLAHPAAEVLRLRGARLAWCDLSDERRVEDAARGADAIFAVTTPFPNGRETEARHGLVLADIARRLEIPHSVYASSAAAATLRGDPLSDGKHEVEQYLRATLLPHTVVCGAFMMENFVRGAWLEGLESGELRLPLPATQKLHQLASADLGRFVRLVLERRDEFIGRRIQIAADALTPIETAATLARASGRPIRHVPDAALDRGDALVACGMLSADAAANIAQLRQYYPEVNWHTLGDWAGQRDWGS
jgi:uncharacterized protein YbjT (DUF2867 family)